MKNKKTNITTKSLNYRRDKRTRKKFLDDIQKRTFKEKFLIELFVQEAIHRGWSISIEDYGIDNTGAYVEKSSCQPDYKIVLNGKPGLYEIKSSPVSHKCTFKKYNLQKYIEINANILLFFGTGFIERRPEDIDYENTRWAIITPKKIKLMLKNKKSYIEPMFGNKPCIKIFDREYKEYFEQNPLLFFQEKKLVS